MLIPFAPFGGLVPRADPLALPAGASQKAVNCRLTAGGILEAFKNPLEVFTPASHNIQTIYRFGQTTNSDTDYWFTSSNVVNYVKGAIANDTTERTYYTGDGFPKMTFAALATADQPFPSAYRRLGEPAPTTAPTLIVTGAYDPTAVLETRYYIYTFVSELGEESGPSPVSEAIEVAPASTHTVPGTAAVAAVLNPDGTVRTAAVEAVAEVKTSFPAQVVSLTMDGPPSGAYVTSTRRIYRTATGSTSTNYLFVAELPVATTMFDDDLLTENLGEVCPSLLYSQLPDLARGLTAMANGMMAAHTDYDVYFCEAYKPYAWPENYISTVGFPIVGLGCFGQTLVVLSNGPPKLLTGSDPQSISEETLPVAYSCMSAGSIVSSMNSVIFAAPDGLVSISSRGPAVLTDALFTRREWTLLNPSSMVCAVWDEKIFIFYRVSDTVKGGLILDTQGGLTETDVYATAAYTDPVTNSLYLAVNDKIVKWDAGTAGTFDYKSRRMVLPLPRNFTYGQILADTYPVTATLHAEVESSTVAQAINTAMPGVFTVSGKILSWATTVASELPFRLPAGFRARYWEIELSGTGKLFNAYLADSIEELQHV